MKLKNIFIMLLFSVFSLILSSQNNRPQKPKAPFNYTSEHVFFTNYGSDSIRLAGTLTIPKNVKSPPVAILISGSGPQNRNEELMDHKPFLVIADYLSNNGIAVLRYDDRGVGESKGNFTTATSFDFATDVEAAMHYLKTRKDIDTKKIGLIGHSEGGLIASIVASKNKDVAFIISLAGTGVTGRKVLESQSWEMAKQMGAAHDVLMFNRSFTDAAYNVITSETNTSNIESKIKASLHAFKKALDDKKSPYAIYINESLINQLASQVSTPWLITFIKTNPYDYWSKTSCPILALNGSKDLQVLPELNLKAIENALKQANNKDFTIKELEGLNHLFQTSETGNPNEYEKIEETFAPKALEIIKDWILERF